MALIFPAIPNNILNFAKTIKQGEVIAFPTETVYGLGANALDDNAVKKIFALKKRPSYNPLIIHFSCLSEITYYFNLNSTELEIAKNFWPGPLTLVLNDLKPKAYNISKYCKGNVDSIAVRIPNHAVALKLIKKAACPIAAPSANISNSLSPTLASHVVSSFKSDSNLKILDGGKSVLGLESTIIEVLQENVINILRPGYITFDILTTKLPKLLKINSLNKDIKSPGLLKKHYSPKTPLRINVNEIFNNEALLIFGNLDINKNNSFKNAQKILNLSIDGDFNEAASNLYSMLWELDTGKYDSIAVTPIPNIGIGIAINERLKKAAVKDP